MDGKNLNNNIGRKRSRGSRRQEICHPRRPSQIPSQPSSTDNDSPPRYLVASNGKRIRDFKINFPGLTPPFDFPDFPPRRRPPETPPEPSSADNDSPPRYLVASNGKRIRDFKINFPGLTPPFDFPVFPPGRRPHQISSDAPRPSASPVPHSSNEHNLSHMRRESEIPVPQPNTPREVEPHLQGPTPELNEAKDESRDQHQGISMNARLEDQTDANIEKK